MTAPLSSMTGFGRSDGSGDGVAWAWELRSVNARGLDLRFRLPPGLDAQEPRLREAAGRLLRRGSVTASLALRRETPTRLVADEAVLAHVLTLALDLARRIPGSSAPRAEALMALPGVLRVASDEPEAGAAGQTEAVFGGFGAALDALAAARRAEGARLSAALTALLGEISALCAQAGAEAADQPAAQRARLLDNLQALLRDTPGLPEERIAQEVALLASRSDVREELERLDSHIQAAHALLAEGANIGRRFDFLAQEFNREVNTLCSKSASAALTATGLRLKAAIEQLREQVQNIE
ncbi:MAG: YicC family protein [Acidisphaera sp.]|nr:YicC family protein [Acidisphaera sp.]